MGRLRNVWNAAYRCRAPDAQLSRRKYFSDPAPASDGVIAANQPGTKIHN